MWETVSGIVLAAREKLLMKRYDRTADMIGQLIGPVVDSAEVNAPGSTSASSPAAAQPYRLVSLLGKQPGRRTFLAVDTRTQANVVIKLLLFGPDFTWEGLKLFEREAETLKSLDHPAIPNYLDSFESETMLGAGFVLVQTYIEAKSLQNWVAGGRRFDESDLVAIAQSLLNILKYLHSRLPAVVHRDLKPSNILLTERSGNSPGELYLIDFGSVQIANHHGTLTNHTLTNGTRTVVGTYGYMPPEQFGGRTLPASDLYSLGATLIYIATGKHPADLTQDDLTIEFDDHQTHLSADLTQWIRQLTYPDLSRRLSSAEQARQQLTEHQGRSHTTTPSIQSQAPLATLQDFKVFVTPRELEIHCAHNRMGENPFSEFLSSGPPVLLVLLLILAMSWQLFFLIALPLAYYLIKKPKKKSTDTAILKLRSASDDSIALSLAPTNQITTIPWVALDAVMFTSGVFSNKFSNRVVFLFRTTASGNRGKIRIDGSSSELRWLCNRISDWHPIPIIRPQP